jgi:hypothetical protein
MHKSWNLLPKILAGEKTIESRWYVARYPPWDKIASKDRVYFKDAGCPVTVKAEVESVLRFENYGDAELKEIIAKYGGSGKICFHSPLDEVYEWVKDRKYCILIFLKNPEKIKPFDIDKAGFGSACAWICVDDILKIKK